MRVCKKCKATYDHVTFYHWCGTREIRGEIVKERRDFHKKTTFDYIPDDKYYDLAEPSDMN